MRRSGSSVLRWSRLADPICARSLSIEDMISTRPLR